MPKLFAPDPGILGFFEIARSSGDIAATLAANSPLFSFRWSDATYLCIPDEIRVVVTVSGVITTSVATALELVIARSFTASDTGGTALTLTGNNNKFRTSHATSLVGDARIATTGTLTAGTRTLDNSAFSHAPFVTGTAVGRPLDTTVLYKRTDLFPIVLAQNEGFIIRNSAAGPATGTFVVHVYVRWFETVVEELIV